MVVPLALEANRFPESVRRHEFVTIVKHFEDNSGIRYRSLSSEMGAKITPLKTGEVLRKVCMR
jgi:hypothetical protein